MKLILSGKGPGKTVIASLLAVTHAIGVYDADPYRALTDISSLEQSLMMIKTVPSPPA